ncbi:MAG: ELM1/GtrOC1 family putative glycosyltransferase, partial [Thiobacillaceae bacterium]
MPHPTPSCLTLWRLIDGKPGHEKQSLGLAQALQRLAAARWYDVRVHGTAFASVRAALQWALRRFPAGHGLPAPDLILAAGHATHLPALAARRAYGGRIVVLMRPSLPLALFDLCLIPAHDQPG